MAAAKTRSRGKPIVKNAAEALEATSSTKPKNRLEPEPTNPPKLYILPACVTAEARIVLLSNPRTSLPARYLVCPENGFYEFTKVGSPKSIPRSWLLTPPQTNCDGDEDLSSPQLSAAAGVDVQRRSGYVTKTAHILVATPVDPLFLMLPFVSRTSSSQSQPTKQLFLAFDDYLDELLSVSGETRALLQKDEIRKTLETRMAVCCDTVDAGDEKMYRFSESKLMEEILHKVNRLLEGGLPRSIEEALIRKVLEAPVTSIKCGEKSINEMEESQTPSTVDTISTTTSGTESQLSSVLIAPGSPLSVSPAAVTICPQDLSMKKTGAGVEPVRTIIAPEGIANLLRKRVALDYICSSYVSPQTTDSLKQYLNSASSPVDFNKLGEHLSHLTALRKEALASYSYNDFSRKRSMADDDAGELRAEKKRKKEEEEKRRKAGESRGVRDLKKVNVNGMKKMSDFFKKK